MKLRVPNLLFFGAIGFTADLVNFGAAQAEIFAATFTFKASSLQLGILGALSSLFYAVPTLLMGMASEKLGRRPLVIMATLGLGLTYAWGAVAGSIRELYLVTSMRSVATAMLWPPVMAWMARAVAPEKFSRFLGAYNLSWASGTFIGFWGAGYLFQIAGKPMPFWVCAAIAAALLAFVVITMPEGGLGQSLAADEQEPAQNSHAAQMTEPTRLFYMKQGLLMAAMGILSASIALFIFPKVGQDFLSEVQLSMLNSLRILGQMIAFFMLGRLASWHYRRWPIFTMAGLLLVGHLFLGGGNIFATVAAGYLLIGLGFGMGFSMCAYYALGLAKKKGTGSGLMETMIGAGGLAGSLIGGSVAYATNPRVGIVVGALPVLVCAFLSTRKMPPVTLKEADQPLGG